MSSTAGAAADDRSIEELLGTSIGQYRIEAQIGQGGMGVVYRAVHTGIGQFAAVKVLSTRCAHNPRDLRRFLNEARAVSRIDHPGLVKIFDFGQTDAGVPYILMEYLRGELLKGRIERLRRERRAMTVGQTLRIGRQTAAALAAVHDKAIVHRDLKPSNLMLVPDEEAPGGERAKLLDFGVARFVAESADRTAPGVVIGTAAYMSPEQCAGMGDVDGRSDLYSLGVMLYEMLAGEPPFQGRFRDLLALHLMQEPRPLGQRVPGLAPEVALFIHQMLAKEPSRRPRVSHIIEELRRWEGETSTLGVVSPVYEEVDPLAQTSSAIRSTRGSTVPATTSASDAGFEAGTPRGPSTHEFDRISTAEQRHGMTTKSGLRPLAEIEGRSELDPSLEELGETTITLPPRDTSKIPEPPALLAPSEERKIAPSPAVEPSIPPASPDLAKVSRRPRGRLLQGLGLLAALATVGAMLGYPSVREHVWSKPPASQTGMVALAGGSFRMGSTAEEIEAECQKLGSECLREELERELPAHAVTLSPFYLDVHETTNAEFAGWLNTIASSLKVLADDDSHRPRFVHDPERKVMLLDLHSEHSGLVYTADGLFEARKLYENKPVVQVTWDGASRYCQGQGKRLPTEAEWEFAARGVSSRRFPWGDERPRCDGVVFGRVHGGPQCNGLTPGVQDVGTASDDRTPEGIMDLGGNAREWVQDQLVPPGYPACEACIDPKEERSMPPGEDVRIQRGGAYSTLDAMTRGARRSPMKRSEAMKGVGFRCAAQ